MNITLDKVPVLVNEADIAIRIVKSERRKRTLVKIVQRIEIDIPDATAIMTLIAVTCGALRCVVKDPISIVLTGLVAVSQGGIDPVDSLVAGESVILPNSCWLAPSGAVAGSLKRRHGKSQSTTALQPKSHQGDQPSQYQSGSCLAHLEAS